MYKKFYGLDNSPFELTPTGGLVYLSDTHREGLAVLKYAVLANKGFVLLTGGVGTGKTTVLNTLLGMVKDKTRICVLNNPTLTRRELYHYLGEKFLIGSKDNKSEFILKFSEYLTKYDETGIKVLLIIDEAQAFPLQLLEEIRLLSNIAGEKNVLTTFLIGQSELQQKLSHPKLLPLRQRIGVTYHLTPLSKPDTAQYISFRLNHAGAVNSNIFTEKAMDRVYKESLGNPRLINIICDNALLLGFSRSSTVITPKIIQDALKTSRLEGENDIVVSPAAEYYDKDYNSHSKHNTLQTLGKVFATLGLLTIICILFIFILSYRV